MVRSFVLAFFVLIFFSCQTTTRLVLSEAERNMPIDFNSYTFSDNIVHPIHTIRISIHVFQDSMGKGNFTQYDSLGQPAVDWYWLSALVEDAHVKMSLLQEMHMPTNSRYIKDSHIRYKVVGQYDWQNQELHELNRVNPATGTQMHRFVTDQEEVTHKSNSLHLFLAGGVNKNGGSIASRGIASGAPDKKWTVLFNYYEKARTTKDYWPASLISHEIGHNLGLRHTWNLNDGCEDTPMNPFHIKKSPSGFQCWAMNSPIGSKCDELEECSNNLMDYNAWQNALTECQMAKIHFNIAQNNGDLQDVIETSRDTFPSQSLVVMGPKKLLDKAEYVLQNVRFGKNVHWYVSPRNAVKQAVGRGNKVSLQRNENYTGTAFLIFEIEDQNERLTIEKKLRCSTIQP